jgi:hypothetical protein
MGKSKPDERESQSQITRLVLATPRLRSLGFPHRSPGQFTKPLDEVDCLLPAQVGEINVTKLFQKRIGEGGEEAAGQGVAGLDLAADRAYA